MNKGYVLTNADEFSKIFLLGFEYSQIPCDSSSFENTLIMSNGITGIYIIMYFATLCNN